MQRLILLFISLLALVCPSAAQTAPAARAQYQKMSAWVRHIVRDTERQAMHRAAPPVGSRVGDSPRLTAFVRVSGDARQVLAPYQARVLTQIDDICIAQMPLATLADASLDKSVQRIEATPSRHQAMMDTTALVLGAEPVYAGTSLPQAYTGRGVVVGVQDIGFDLTHPTLYDTTGTT